MKYKPGDQIESYRLLRECGSGAYGTVFLAENVVSGQKYALKIIPENNLFSQRELRGIVQYMQICPRSGLMQIYHAGRCGDSFYYVMDAADDLNSGAEAEYLPDTLENRMKREGRIPPQSLLEIAKQTEERLRFLHRAGFLHRDIKPGNILFLNGEAVPGDIGLLTGTPGSTLAGTPGFLSPQAAAGTRPFTPEDDFYALGKTLYCALTGYPPEKYPAFPSDLSLKECKEVIELYNRWCAGHCEPEPGKKSKKKIWIAAGTAAAALCLLLAAGVFFMRHDPGSPSPQTQNQSVGPVRKQFCSVKEALQSAEKRIAAHVVPPELVKLRPKLEAEKKRLWNLRTRRGREAYDRPVSQEDLERAARNPESAPYDAEIFVRIKRSDAAVAAFDREHENDPVIAYFKTSNWITMELNRLRALAPMPGLEMTDFSADRKKFAEACERLVKLEREIMKNRSFK